MTYEFDPYKGGHQAMELIKQVLLSKLINQGILDVRGKPIEDASIEELQDEWNQYELSNSDS